MGVVKHGEGSLVTGRTKLYQVWAGMRARCRDPKHASFKYYGARGIKVVEEWQDYRAFREWAMWHGYVEDHGLEIDRIDADGHYGPDNCRWITVRANRRRQKPTYVAFDEAKTMMEWSEDERCLCSYYTLRNRIQRGWDIEESITMPTGARPRSPAFNWKGEPIKGRKRPVARIPSLRVGRR